MAQFLEVAPSPWALLALVLSSPLQVSVLTVVLHPLSSLFKLKCPEPAPRAGVCPEGVKVPVMAPPVLPVSGSRATFRLQDGAEGCRKISSNPTKPWPGDEATGDRAERGRNNPPPSLCLCPQTSPPHPTTRPRLYFPPAKTRTSVMEP